MNIISKAALLMLVLAASADKAPPLRGVSQPTSEEIETIIHQAKRDAFVTVMEMGKEEFGGCANKNGCAVGYDYCTKSKAHGKRCGPCVVTDQHPTGQCSEPNIDKEQAIVDSLSEEELLSIKIDAFVAVMEAGNTKNSCSRKSCAAAVAASGYDYCTAGNTKWSTPMCGPCDMDTGHCSWPPTGFNIDKERTIVDSLSKEELLDIVAEVMDGERFNPVDKATSSANKAAHKATSAANGASKKAISAADGAANKATAAADKAAKTARKQHVLVVTVIRDKV